MLILGHLKLKLGPIRVALTAKNHQPHPTESPSWHWWYCVKVTTAAGGWDGGRAWLAVAILVNTLLSLFYYLRWIVPTYRPSEPVEQSDRGAFVPRPWAARAAVTAAVWSVGAGLAGGPLWALVDGPLRR